MVSKHKTKQLVGGKLTGKEVAAILLTDMVQYSFDQERTYSEAERQSAYNGLDGRIEQYEPFNKWKELGNLIAHLHSIASIYTLSAANYLNITRQKLELVKLLWLIDGCEDAWQQFLDAKRQQIGKYGLEPHIVNHFNPLHFREELMQKLCEEDFIYVMYQSAVRHVKYFVACQELVEIIEDILGVDFSPTIADVDSHLNLALCQFNHLCDDLDFADYLAEEHPGIKPLLIDMNIAHIDVEAYQVSEELISKLKADLINASKDDLLRTCGQTIEEIAEAYE